jgi:Ribbon-helix-helix protein, copG family.
MKKNRKFVGFLADVKAKQELRHIAYANGRTMSDVMREALDKYIEEALYAGGGSSNTSKNEG